MSHEGPATGPAKVIVEYPHPPQKSLVTITDADLHRLRSGEMLNDSLVHYWMLSQFTDLAGEEQALFFGPLFYTRLASNGGIDASLSSQDKFHARYEKVRRWYKDKSIFEKKYLFFPICQGLHWSLAVVCNPGGFRDNYMRSRDEDTGEKDFFCMYHFDSLDMHSPSKIKEHLCSYLSHKVVDNEFSYQEKSALSDSFLAKLVYQPVPILSSQGIPKQQNSIDCGLFTLKYMEGTTMSVNSFILCCWD